jgi:hypothetical protein
LRSTTVTRATAEASSTAAESPANPAPITTTCGMVAVGHDMVGKPGKRDQAMVRLRRSKSCLRYSSSETSVHTATEIALIAGPGDGLSRHRTLCRQILA